MVKDWNALPQETVHIPSIDKGLNLEGVKHQIAIHSPQNLSSLSLFCSQSPRTPLAFFFFLMVKNVDCGRWTYLDEEFKWSKMFNVDVFGWGISLQSSLEKKSPPPPDPFALPSISPPLVHCNSNCPKAHLGNL